MFFIWKLRLAWVACFGFFNEEYLIALVDFIAPCGGTIERGERDLRIPFSPPSGLPPSFLGNRCGGTLGCRGFMTILESGVRCYRSSPLRRGVWVLCVRLCIVRVSVGLVWLISFVFHYWVEKRRCLCSFFARFLITADRDICFNNVCCKPISPIRLGRTVLEKCVRAV